MIQFDAANQFWMNEPKDYEITDQMVQIKTEPGTDLWQRTFYGFQHDNVPALLVKTTESAFSFTVCTDFNAAEQYDQCGLIVYQDSDNWVKASVEYENELFQRLGSVVTNHGFSDWATIDITSKVCRMYYRLSRKGQDFKLEFSPDGHQFQQMRIFHLTAANAEINIGIYACSPKLSSFKAMFSEIKFAESCWKDE